MALGFLTCLAPVKPFSRARNTLKRFYKDRAGAVALLFGLTLIPMIGFVGGAVDYANAYRMRSKLQNAMDSATLAVGREVDMGAESGNARQVGLDVLSANLGADFPQGYSVEFNIDGTLVTGTADLGVDTYLLGVLGMHKLDVGTTSIVNISNGTIEVALVLDNSGSMGGSKIADLRDAAESLTEILFAAQRSTSTVSIGIVPFAGAVNVGTGNANASWMDTTGQSSIHFENFSNNVTRLSRFNAMSNTSWGGCVEVRPAPHDVTDSDPTGGDSLFVHYFAPDEPDDKDSSGSSSYANNYLDDDGGSCGTPPNNETQVQAQEKTCKYDNESPSGGSGPNYRCTSRPILPLSDNEGEIVSAINAMQASGMTNIHEGVMWGWRILSPGEPFTEGRADEETSNRKFMVVMTDGKNTHTGKSHQNRSSFSAYGFSKNGRLRSPTSRTSRLERAMNTKTETSCTNAKANDVTIFTIAVEVSDDTTIDMLRRCASGDSRAFSIENSNTLDEVFEAIADEINQLRITS